MNFVLLKLPDVAEKIGKSPRWLRDHLRRHPIGRRAGRDIVFTETDIRSLYGSLGLELPEAYRASAGRRRKAERRPWRTNQPKVNVLAGTSVYFIASGQYIKIGFTVNVDRRLRILQIAHPEPIELIFHMDGGPVEEAALHQKFAAHRVRGEWFRFSEEIRNWIREQGGEPP